MAAPRVLAVAVAAQRAAYVCLQDRELDGWGTTEAPKLSADLVGFVQGIINTAKPDVVVTEQCGTGCRKGQRTQELIRSIAQLASHNAALDISVPRPRTHPSKYEEAEALAARYPEIAGYLPKRKRRIFDNEPYMMILFEALALAECARTFDRRHDG